MLPDGWENRRLEEVCRLWNGKAYKKEELLERGKYLVLRVGNFFTNDRWYYSDLELEDEKYCDDGDLLYAWSASFGPRIWNGGKVIYHYHIWKIAVDERLIDRDFLFHFLDWDAEQIKSSMGSGSTMIHVTKGAMEQRSILLPPLDEQRRIAEVLRSVDEAIAAKHATLAATKQFKRTCREAAVIRFQDCAPTAMQDVLASIDAGWSPDCESEPANDGEWSILKTSSVVWDGYDDGENKRLPPHLEQRPHLEVTANDILITRAGPAERTGVVAIVRETAGRRMLSDKIIRLRVSPEKAVPLAIAELLSSDHVQSELIRSKSGMAASQTNISQKIVLGLEMHLPSLTDQRDFADEMAALQDAIELGEAELHDAQRLKAALMSDLLSGRVRVPA